MCLGGRQAGAGGQEIQGRGETQPRGLINNRPCDPKSSCLAPAGTGQPGGPEEVGAFPTADSAESVRQHTPGDLARRTEP